MIDIVALVGLFPDLLEASKNWTEPKIVRFDRLADLESEPAVRELKAKGHTFNWVREARVRQLVRDGWKLFIERDAIGRPKIFTDRLEELVLIHRPPTQQKTTP